MARSGLRIFGAAVVTLAVSIGGFRWFVRQPTFTDLPRRPEARASAERLRAHVEFLSVTASPRDVQHPENLDRAASYLASAFVVARLPVEKQAFAVRGQVFRNVIARLGPEGRNPLVVGAHYDAFGPETLDYGRMAQVVDGVANAVVWLTESEHPIDSL